MNGVGALEGAIKMNAGHTYDRLPERPDAFEQPTAESLGSIEAVCLIIRQSEHSLVGFRFN